MLHYLHRNDSIVESRPATLYGVSDQLSRSDPSKTCPGTLSPRRASKIQWFIVSTGAGPHPSVGKITLYHTAWPSLFVIISIIARGPGNNFRLPRLRPAVTLRCVDKLLAGIYHRPVVSTHVSLLFKIGFVMIFLLLLFSLTFLHNVCEKTKGHV